jgi:hypothetical protein
MMKSNVQSAIIQGDGSRWEADDAVFCQPATKGNTFDAGERLQPDSALLTMEDR